MSIFFVNTQDAQISNAFLATLGAAPGSTYLAQVKTFGLVPSVQAMINATGSSTAAALSTKVATNLGLTGSALTGGTAYLSSVTFAGSSSAWAANLMETLNLFSTLQSDATYGSAATAYLARVNSAVSYSSVAGNNSTDLSTLAAAVGSAGSTGSGSTFTLTTGVDTLNNFTGNLGNDTFIVTTATDDDGDELDGGAGTDTLKATLSDDLAAILAVNIEILQVRATAAAIVDMDYVPDATKVINLNSADALTIANFDNVESIDINGASADTNLTTSSATDQSLIVNVTGVADADNADFDIDVAGSANDVTSITFNALTDSSFADIRVDEVETLTINATGDFEAEDMSEAAALVDIIASGAGDITLHDLTDATLVETLTHTGSGAVNVELLNDTDLVVSTGSGDDRVAVTDAELNADDSINLGGGTNTLAIGVNHSGTFTLTSAIMGVLSGVDIIELATQAGGAGADTVTLDAAELHNRFSVGVINDTSDQADDVYAFDSVNSGVEVIIKATVATIDVDLETANGTTDSITLTIGGSAATKIDTKADIDGFETINIATVGTKAVTIDDLDADAATAINITGTASSVTFTDISDITATTVIDASQFVGDFTIALMGEAAKTIRGSSTGTNDITLAAGGLAQGKTFTAGSADDDVLTVVATSAQDAGIVSLSGFENVEIGTHANATDTFAADFRNAQDIGTLNLTSGDNTDNITLNRLSADTIISIDDTFGNVTLSLQSGTSHTISAKAGTTSVVDGTLTVDGAATVLNMDASDAALRLDAVAGADLDQIIITGDNAATVSSVPSGVSLIDASAMTAGTFTAVAASGGTTIKAGAGASVMTGGAGEDVFHAGSGVDKIVVGDVTDGDIDEIIGFKGGTDEIYAAGATTDDTTAVIALNNLGVLSANTYADLDEVLAAFAAAGALETDETEAYLFTYDGQQYLLVDAAGDGYSAAADALIKLTGVSGTIVADDIIYT